uniref:ABC transporter C family member 13 n=1 Tax=Quercus lobata TaxID=97700 RepID=A0A7N2R4R9_QUELO
MGRWKKMTRTMTQFGNDRIVFARPTKQSLELVDDSSQRFLWSSELGRGIGDEDFDLWWQKVVGCGWWVVKGMPKILYAFMLKIKGRIRRTDELLTYIRTLKMYGWELLFSSWLMETRSSEVAHLSTRKYLDAWCVFFWAATPALFSLFTFGLFALMGHQLDAATVFTCLALFNTLISPLNSFPWVINGLIDAVISTRRLSRFLSCSEHKYEVELMADSSSPDLLNEQSAAIFKDMSIAIHDACCAWSCSNEKEWNMVLNHVTLELPKGSFVAVIGERSFHRIQSAPKAKVVVVDGHQYHGGARNNGKEKVTVFQNLKYSNPSNLHRDQGHKFSGKDAAQFGANILSNINVIAERDLLTLDISLCVERQRGAPRPSIKSYVENLEHTWGNSKDWVLELRGGRQIAIPLSIYLSLGSMLDFLELEGVEGQDCEWGDSDGGLVNWKKTKELLVVQPLAMANPVAPLVEAEGFVEKVRTWWESYHFQGSPSFLFASKLKALKLDLRKWNEEEFGNVGDKMNKLWKDLEILDLLEDTRPLTNDETLEKERFCIKACISQFYKQLYSENEDQRPMLDGVEFSTISKEEATWLDRPFEEEEVFGVIQGCDGDKSPRPNGFLNGFFKIGSGKSSLLNSILGEMHVLHGLIHSSGSIAYVPQVPWILSGTVRDNILFGKNYDPRRYSDTLQACALDVDISLMIGGDMAYIGEKGVNISGGQRARLALARAIYHGSDIFMLDDVLSAIDAQVAQWILYNAILGPLMKQCTRVLCTHNVQDQPIRGLFSMKEISHIVLEHIVYIHIVLLHNNDTYY